MTESDGRRRFTGLQLFGAFITLASLVLVAVPTLAGDAEPAPDLFEATERHVRWGLGIALGAVLLANRWRRPWSVLVAWIVFCISGGYLLARFIGIALEGATNLKQWGLVAVEVLICALTAAWIRHRSEAPDRPRPAVPQGN